MLDRETFIGLYGEPRYMSAVEAAGNRLFQAVNITSWGGLIWVGVGLLGQVAFFLRMLVQWVVSERKRQSVIPEAYWYFSFFGGVALFAYFAWRQDLIGVLGQTTGVVVYARNLRLKLQEPASRASEACRPRIRAGRRGERDHSRSW